MTETQEPAAGATPPTDAEIAAHRRSVAAVAEATHTAHQLQSMVDFHDDRYEWRRLFSELLGTFMLVFVAAGGGIVNARFGGSAIPQFILVTAPGMMVLSIILFMGAISGAHLNPGVSLAFALLGDFPWRRVPGYIVVRSWAPSWPPCCWSPCWASRATPASPCRARASAPPPRLNEANPQLLAHRARVVHVDYADFELQGDYREFCRRRHAPFWGTVA
jgi:hypothetical protein